MAKKHGLLLLVLWLMSMSFAFAGPNITDFKKIIPSIQLKKSGSLTYRLFSHNNCSLQLLVDNADCNEYSCSGVMRFVHGGKAVSSWFGPGVNNPEKELIFYYSESAKAYYVINDVEADDAEAFEIYFITGTTAVYEGLYLPVNDASQPYFGKAVDAPVIAIARKNNATRLTYTNSAGETVLEFSRQDSGNVNLLPDSYKKLAARAAGFNWTNGFTPTLKYTLNIDLNGNGKPEKYLIDWSKKTAFSGNADAGTVTAAKEMRFEGQTLVLYTSSYWKNDNETYTYYFTLSTKYNTACLDKYTHFTYRSPVDRDTEAPCNLSETYYPDEREPATLEQFGINNENAENFCHSCYVRRFTVKELTRLLMSKEKSNTLFNGCAPAPNASEIDAMLKAQPLTAASVQQYNDIAYYMLEHPADNDEKETLNISAVFLLEQTTAKFPDRVVAWLNLADAYWENSVLKHKAGDAYKRYLGLMEILGKDMTKVPARVRERI